MTDRSLLARVADAFVAPADDGPPRDVRRESAASAGRLSRTFVAPLRRAEAVETAAVTTAILCGPDDARFAGSAVALADRGAAVVVAWGDGVRPPSTRAPVSRAARRLAESLTSRGHEAVATGRLVHVLVDDLPRHGARVAAAAGSARCVAVVAGPRDDAVDAILRLHDRVLVDADDAVADLALLSLAHADVPASRLVLADAPPAARALAEAGVALTPALRRLLAEATR